MQKYANQICKNMHFQVQNMHKYASICPSRYMRYLINMHKGKNAITCKLKYAEICTKYAQNMQKYAVAPDVCLLCIICIICKRYVEVYKIFKHEIHVQT